MAEVAPFLSTSRYAVVTGGNKGLGLGICKQLASNGVTVILTARDEIKGLEAVKILKDSNSGFSDLLIFHQLDVTNPKSIASLSHFVTTQFGELDILVNNAGLGGIAVDADGLRSAAESGKSFEEINWSEISTQPPELLEECINTNYYGPKAMTEALIPLLQLSDSARIVNVSSSVGKLKNLKHERAKAVFNDAENLTEEKIDEVVKEFLKDLKDDCLVEKGWPEFYSAYIASKAALNAYTRVMAKKFPSICMNSVCPGFVKTDINYNNGMLSVEEGADSPVRLALMPNGGHSGLFFIRREVSPF